MNRLITKIVNGANVVNSPMHVYAPVRRGIAPLAIAGISAAMSLGTSLWGASKSAKAAEEAAEEARRQKARDDAWYERRYNEDYLDTAAGRNLIRQARDYANENWKKARGQAAVGGATDASVALAKEAGNKMVANTIGNIAAADTARKEGIDRMHRQDEKSYSQTMQNINNQRAQNISNAASAASNAIMQVGSAAALSAGSGTSNAPASTPTSNASGVENAVNGGGQKIDTSGLGDAKGVSVAPTSVSDVAGKVDTDAYIDDSFIKGLNG